MALATIQRQHQKPAAKQVAAGLRNVIHTLEGGRQVLENIRHGRNAMWAASFRTFRRRRSLARRRCGQKRHLLSFPFLSG